MTTYTRFVLTGVMAACLVFGGIPLVTYLWPLAMLFVLKLCLIFIVVWLFCGILACCFMDINGGLDSNRMRLNIIARGPMYLYLILRDG